VEWTEVLAGALGGLAVGPDGTTVVGASWGGQPMPGYGPAGVQLFEIDAAGNVTQGDDLVSPMSTSNGEPAALCALATPGAGRYQAVFFGEWDAYGTTDTLYPTLYRTDPEAGTGCSKAIGIDRDAAGDTFVTSGVLGDFSGEPNVVTKLDSTGAALWTAPQVPANASAFTWFSFLQPTVAADGAGGVYLGAYTGFGAPMADLGCGPVSGTFLMQLDTTGACLWSVASPGLVVGPVGALLPAGGGRVVVSAPFQGTVDLGCGPMTSTSGTSTLVAELGACGTCVWSRSFATPWLDVRRVPGGDLLLSTSYSGTLDLGGGLLHAAGTSDIAVGRLSAAGAPLWSRTLGTAGAAVTWDQTFTWGQASADASGGLALVLSVAGTANFGQGPVSSGTVLLKLDGSGALRWQRAPFSGMVAADPCGAVIAASDCAGCAPMGDEGVSIVKLAP
jgi:hypothetical protein